MHHRASKMLASHALSTPVADHIDQPRFLAVRVGDLVAVHANHNMDASSDWWLGQVIHAEGGARCNANSLFQIACVDSGVIRTVNADAVIEILQGRSAALEPAHDHGHQSQRSGQSYQEGDRHGR